MHCIKIFQKDPFIYVSVLQWIHRSTSTALADIFKSSHTLESLINLPTYIIPITDHLPRPERLLTSHKAL